jgi:hypothetical protein
MTSLRSMWAATAFATLAIASVQGSAMTTQQGTPGVHSTTKNPEIEVAPSIGPWSPGGLDFGSDTSSTPAQPEIKVAPGGPSTAGDGNGFDFG